MIKFKITITALDGMYSDKHKGYAFSVPDIKSEENKFFIVPTNELSFCIDTVDGLMMFINRLDVQSLEKIQIDKVAELPLN